MSCFHAGLRHCGAGRDFTVVALLVLRPAAVLLGATAELLDDCILYGTIITVFQTAFMLQFLFQSFFITAENQSWAFSLPWQPA